MLPQMKLVHKVPKMSLSMKNPNDLLFLINVLYMDQFLSFNILGSVFYDSDIYFLLINDKQKH